MRTWSTAALLILSSVIAIAQPKVPDATPVDAIPAILDLFKTYQVVGLGEGPHGNLEGAAFRLKLIRDPRLPGIVDDILIETGTARYQDVVDRYVRGENVPRQELRRAWEDTTNPGSSGDRGQTEELFTAVRTVNLKVPREKQIRLLMGDPPIAWEFVRNPTDWRHWNMQRDSHAFAVLKRESLSKNRHPLIIWGDGHFQGRGFKPLSITNLVERGGFKMITISPRYDSLIRLEPSVASWKAPSFAMVRGTSIGKKYYAQFYQIPPAPGWNTVLMEEQFDAVLYLGPNKPTMPLMPKSLCLDPAYMKMRLARLAAVAPSSVEPFKKLCADLTR